MRHHGEHGYNINYVTPYYIIFLILLKIFPTLPQSTRFPLENGSLDMVSEADTFGDSLPS